MSYNNATGACGDAGSGVNPGLGASGPRVQHTVYSQQGYSLFFSNLPDFGALKGAASEKFGTIRLGKVWGFGNFGFMT